jgi:hypothetical protein
MPKRIAFRDVSAHGPSEKWRHDTSMSAIEATAEEYCSMSLAPDGPVPHA